MSVINLITMRRFCFYTPEIGIWLSVDPLSDERPSLSPYNYCQLNPVMRIDYMKILDNKYFDAENVQTTFDQLKCPIRQELSKDKETCKIKQL